jgi:rod shape-determining protein MreD
VRWFWIVLIGFLLLAFETGVVSQVRDFAWGPDLLLLFVVFLALYGPVEDAPISGWLLGIAKDALSAGTLGLFAVLFMGLSFLLSRIRADIFLEYNKSHVVNAALSTLLVYLGAAVWQWLEGTTALGLVGGVLGVSLWNAALAPFVFGLLFKLAGPLKTPRRRAWRL